MTPVATGLNLKRAKRLFGELACGESDTRKAQALSCEVFAQELGSKLASADVGLDRDDFDNACYQLLVRNAASARAVGCCTRILTDRAARRIRRFYFKENST
jgi:putative hemolysin